MRSTLSGCIFLLTLVACSQPEQDDRVIFRYNQAYTVTSLDPAFARNISNIWSVDHIFNTLIQLDDSLQTKPCVATRWEITDGGRKMIFHLRPDVRFHDDTCFEDGRGRFVTAHDFVYSFKRIIDPAVNSPGSWVFKGRVDSLEPFAAVNDTVLEVNLIKPFSPMLQILTMQYCAVVPKEAVEMYGKEFRSHPVGTGPFRLVKWIEGQTMILSKNEAYFEKHKGEALPYVDGVRVEFIGDRKSAFLQLLEGKIDFISGFDPGMAYELFTREGNLRDKYAGRINYYESPYLNFEYLGINPEASGANRFLSDRRFRQALNYGFDRIELLRTIRRGVGTPATAAMVPYGLPSFDTSVVRGYRYDPQMTRRLLTECGYLQLPFEQRPILELYASRENADYCLFMIRQWEAAGIRCKLSLSEAATIREMMRKGAIPFFKANWSADYPDAENFLILFHSSQGAPPNYTRFKDATYDRLYAQEISASSPADIYPLIHRMEQIAVREAPVVFMYYDAASIFTSTSITDYQPNAMNLLKVKYIRKNKAK